MTRRKPLIVKRVDWGAPEDVTIEILFYLNRSALACLSVASKQWALRVWKAVMLLRKAGVWSDYVHATDSMQFLSRISLRLGTHMPRQNVSKSLLAVALAASVSSNFSREASSASKGTLVQGQLVSRNGSRHRVQVTKRSGQKSVKLMMNRILLDAKAADASSLKVLVQSSSNSSVGSQKRTNKERERETHLEQDKRRDTKKKNNKSQIARGCRHFKVGFCSFCKSHADATKTSVRAREEQKSVLCH